MSLLRSAGKATSPELVAKFWPKGEVPFDARNILSAMLRKIASKAEFNREKWSLKHSKRNGPHPVKWWVEEKKK